MRGLSATVMIVMASATAQAVPAREAHSADKPRNRFASAGSVRKRCVGRARERPDRRARPVHEARAMKPTFFLFALLLPMVSTAKERHLGEPKLSGTARALIKQRMSNHSKNMTELVWAVVFLDYRESAQLASVIAHEPRLARPTTGDATELNSAIPPRFFELQDELRARALRLEASARLRDPGSVAKSYGALAETCVSCHDAYMATP